MAFTITMLAWSVADFGSQLAAKNELSNALEAVKWGTDYLLKAHTQADVLYGEVGDGDSDHACWQRPEEMTTPRTTFKIDAKHPGSDLAGETAAALAAASIAFQKSDPQYSSTLLGHAKQLFEFGRDHVGLYQSSIPAAGEFYKSSGYEDELLWAAIWLHRAIGGQNDTYLDYVLEGSGGDTRTMFSWDDKFVGVQFAVVRESLIGGLNGTAPSEYLDPFVEFICNCIQEGVDNVQMTDGGLLWWQAWNNLQYTTSTALVIASYSEYLRPAHANLECPDSVTVTPDDLIDFVKSQVDYILGSNPKKMSYMVGMGSNYPKHIHHRGASIVSIKKDPTPVTCKGGYDIWFYKNATDPNVLDGAIVGGPDLSDSYTDVRSNYPQAEPATVNTAPLVGVLALLASRSSA
ncbi:Glycoside hydrolase [Macleaya cordata]|uniref:Endoglucanase n=1 Tax=Macleaya cordata TaxID=56857 RepID=A0A200PX32_MACCD|nr:Glycoside hydrolase [Macleaya cordata]